jgi:sterol 14-demethylase
MSHTGGHGVGLAVKLAGEVKEWYSTHPFGQYVLALVLIFWGGHIISQLVYSSRNTKQKVPQDKTKPPMVFHFFPWVGSMVIYGMEPYKFFTKYRAKVYSF